MQTLSLAWTLAGLLSAETAAARADCGAMAQNVLQKKLANTMDEMKAQADAIDKEFQAPWLANDLRYFTHTPSGETAPGAGLPGQVHRLSQDMLKIKDRIAMLCEAANSINGVETGVAKTLYQGQKPASGYAHDRQAGVVQLRATQADLFVPIRTESFQLMKQADILMKFAAVETFYLEGAKVQKSTAAWTAQIPGLAELIAAAAALGEFDRKARLKQLAALKKTATAFLLRASSAYKTVGQWQEGSEQAVQSLEDSLKTLSGLESIGNCSGRYAATPGINGWPARAATMS